MHEPCEKKLDLSGQALRGLGIWAVGGRGVGCRGEQVGKAERLEQHLTVCLSAVCEAVGSAP